MITEGLLEMDNVVFDRIRQDLADNDVVLYMKGTPVFPQCGFSAAVVQILTYLGVRFKGVDVMSDSAIREGICKFNDWPTFPQLFIKGKFVGGCDIAREMFDNGELVSLLNEHQIENNLSTA